MEFLLNDLSFHGQFFKDDQFKSAVELLMGMRRVALTFGREIHCHKNVVSVQISPGRQMQQAMQCLSHNERQAFVAWIIKNGPYWDDNRNHGPDDFFESEGEIVTDTALGEAAWCLLNQIPRELVSVSPSKWQSDPILVDWIKEGEGKKSASINNYWDKNAFEVALKALSSPILSWSDLQRRAIAECPRLFFSADAFTPLNGHPFVISAANRVIEILKILNNLKACVDDSGKRTAEGHEIYQDFFTGKKGGGGRGAIFSDSSDSEKSTFKTELTFPHPELENETIFCPLHGKVQTPAYRVHYSGPVSTNEPTYVVYIGPKLTV